MTGPRLIATGLPELLPQRNRSVGLHLSTIINDLCLRLGYYRDNADADRPTNLMEVGSALEHAIAHRLSLQFPGRYFRQWDPVVEHWANGIELSANIPVSIPAANDDGQPARTIWIPVYGTVDLWDLQDGAIEDVKFTKKSSRTPITDRKFEPWWWQVKGYCKMSGCRIGRLRPVHINGNYDRAEGVDAYVPLWEWRFTEEDIERNWTMIATHGARMYSEKMQEAV